MLKEIETPEMEVIESDFCETAIKKVEDCIALIDKYNHTGPTQKERVLDQILRSIERLRFCVKREYVNTGHLCSYQNLMSGDYVCVCHKDAYRYTLRFNRLLPKREERESVIACLNAIKKSLFSIDVERFNERALFCFVHHYSKDIRTKDYDNLESKPFIDLLATYFLENDDPEHLALYYDYKQDDADYTEIILLPVSLAQTIL